MNVQNVKLDIAEQLSGVLARRGFKVLDFQSHIVGQYCEILADSVICLRIEVENAHKCSEGECRRLEETIKEYLDAQTAKLAETDGAVEHIYDVEYVVTLHTYSIV